MNSDHRLFMNVVEETLQFEYHDGDVTRVTHPHATGWRTLPSLMTAHITGYDARIRRKQMADCYARSSETICISPDIFHIIEMTTRKPGISRWSHTSFRILNGIDVVSLLDPPMAIAGPAARRIGDINEKLAALGKSANPSLSEVFQRKSLSAALIAVIAEVAPLREGSLAMVRMAQRLAPVIAYITQHLDAELSRTALAAIAEVSPTRLDALFNSALGVSPGVYVLKVRLRRAQQLLLTSDLSVKEISSTAGYGDEFHFSRIFKKYSGASPLHFRQTARTGAM